MVNIEYELKDLIKFLEEIKIKYELMFKTEKESYIKYTKTHNFSTAIAEIINNTGYYLKQMSVLVNDKIKELKTLYDEYLVDKNDIFVYNKIMSVTYNFDSQILIKNIKPSDNNSNYDLSIDNI